MDGLTHKKQKTGDSMKKEREIRRKEEELLLGNRNPLDLDPEGIPPHQPNMLENDRYPKSHDR